MRIFHLRRHAHKPAEGQQLKPLPTAESDAAVALVAMQAAPHADKPLMEEDAVCSGSDHEIEVLDKGGDDDYSGPDSDEESVGRDKDSSESEEDKELDASKYAVQVFSPQF